jgi:hypothetical protein
MNATKHKALEAMASGGLLYVYVEPKGLNISGKRYPAVGSGVIVYDGKTPVSARIVTAINNLGTRWCAEVKALVMTEDAKLQVRGWYKMPDDIWLPGGE